LTMNSDQLEQFRTIAVHGNITKAADVLYLSQPALSKTLKNLETELGCKLFYRVGRKLNITKEGKRLLEYANTVISTLDIAKQEFLSLEKGRKIRLYSTGYYLPELLKGYYEKNISDLELHVVPDDAIPAMLIDKHAEAVIADDYYLRHYGTKDLEKILLFKEQLLFCVPKGHRLCFRDWLPLREIQGEPLLYIDMHADMDSWITEVLKLNNCKLNIKLRLDSLLFEKMREDLNYPYLESSVTNLNNRDPEYLADRKQIRINAMYTSRYIYLWFYRNNRKNLSSLIEAIKANAQKVADKAEML